MKLERLHEYITITVVTALGIGFALYCGKQTGSGQAISGLALIGVIAVVLLFIKLKTNSWILIPLFWPITDQLAFLPGAVPLRDAVVITIFGAFLVFKALKICKIKPVYEWINLILLANILYLVSAFVRNPVGTDSMGTDRVGGRPYFDVIFACLAYWVIQRVRIDAKTSQRLPLIMSAGVFFNSTLEFLSDFFPSTTPYIGKVFSGFSAETLQQAAAQAALDTEQTRLQYLSPAGTSIFQLLFARYVPTSVLNPLFFGRFFLAAISVIFILLSGHRIGIIYTGGIFFLALYFRKGISSVITGAALAIPLLALLIALQGNVLTLPFAAQRALSFLPGKWDANAVENARGSSEWRFEMWKIVLTTDKYISNKWLGDGFGFTRTQLEQMRSLVTDADIQENFMISGDYHSGPVATIRFVGYVGLALFLILLGSIVHYGWRLIRAAQNTPFYYLALFLGLPAIFHFFAFIFIFGDFKNDLARALFTTAMMQMTSASIALFKEGERTAKRQKLALNPSFPKRPSLPGLETTLTS